MLYIWWKIKGKNFLSFNRITQRIISHQPDRLNNALQMEKTELINRKVFVFHQDMARPHISLVTHRKLLHIEWDTMPHSLCSPDLVTLDHYYIIYDYIIYILLFFNKKHSCRSKNPLFLFFFQVFEKRNLILIFIIFLFNIFHYIQSILHIYFD